MEEPSPNITHCSRPGILRSAYKPESERTAVLSRCCRRACSWRIPPNWSAADWFQEVRAIVAAAAWQAVSDLDHYRALAPSAVLYQRVMARCLARYRQEWSYGLHCLPEDVKSAWSADCFAKSLSPCASDSSASPADSFDNAELRRALHVALMALPEPDRWLIHQLFWEERTESELADLLGVNQSTVSRRKNGVLRDLNRNLYFGAKFAQGHA